ncbi:type IV secretory system conjugative DNA transfer family protein [Gordonia tangerina]|uniref:Type IV secretory system conjugative DNA transfer family protein n=1 Tax=Gordonia tangerina TaxID=2911060 RepID=A0ABS9DD86_9ACTN|nr:type IV secretory system conjugative DNA transfer family protein [Gordonia tangerina]MCF3937182.1 type IV secretory system conjugative DNA transfer family protein [Gordonia tangerina]
MTNYYEHNALVDTPSERILLWFAKIRWGQRSVGQGGVPPYGPLAGWDQHTPVSWRNTRNARRFDPAFPLILAALGIIPTMILGTMMSIVLAGSLIGAVIGPAAWVIAQGIRWHRRRSDPKWARAKRSYLARRTWSMAMLHNGLLGMSLDPRKADIVPGIKFGSLKAAGIATHSRPALQISGGAGITGYTVDLPQLGGIDRAAIERAREGIAATVGARILRVEPPIVTDTGRAFSVRCTVLSHDPTQVSLPFDEGDLDSVNLAKVRIGHDDKGRNTAIPLILSDGARHAMIAGQTRSGKSSLVHGIILQAAAAGAKVFIGDLKGELALPYAAAHVGAGYAGAPDEMRDLLGHVISIMDRRNSTDRHDRSPILVVLDELSSVPVSGPGASKVPETREVVSEIWSRIGTLAKKAASANISLILVGQVLNAAVMGGTDIRDQIATRIQLRAREYTTVMMTLGVDQGTAQEIVDHFRGLSAQEGSNRVSGVGFLDFDGAPGYFGIRTSYLETQSDPDHPLGIPHRIIDLAESLHHRDEPELPSSVLAAVGRSDAPTPTPDDFSDFDLDPVDPEQVTPDLFDFEMEGHRP